MPTAMAPARPRQPSPRVGPMLIPSPGPVSALRARKPLHLFSLLSLLYHWCLWIFFTGLIFGQALGITWTKAASHLHLYFGQDPSLGVYQVVGTNDAPFADRAYVCSLYSRIYKPVQLQDALDSPSTTSVLVSNVSGNEPVNGYRVVKRAERFQISELTRKGYENTCDVIATTIDTIFARCEELGYVVTRDTFLRIVVDDNSNDDSSMRLLSDTLPVVVIPFSDDTFYSRYVIPGEDGSACMFRLNGAYETKGYPDFTFRAVNRTVREQRTVEMLRKPGGTWRNGWYEDPDGSKWFSDVMSTGKTRFDIAIREFDMLHNTERDCADSANACGRMIRHNWWGAHLSSTDDPLPYTSVTIMDAKHFGLFLFEASVERSVESVYDVNMVLANFSLGTLLIRWLIASVTMLNSYRSGVLEKPEAVGIGVLSCARSFHCLPIFLLPRLKTHLAVFATIGCTYDGAQIALSQAWFLMYPGIAELLFLVYSLLNLVAKLLRRRMSDILFGPTLFFFCAMHYMRTDLAQSGWFEYDGRMPTILTSDDFDRLSVLDFFRSDTLLKLNGNVKSLFLIKVGVLSLNLLPLLLFSRSTAAPNEEITATEACLALHRVSSGGLGAIRAPLRPPKSTSKTGSSVLVLSSFELLRLGYLVLDESWLISIDDWYLFALTSALRNPSTCVMLFAVKQSDGDGLSRTCYVDEKPLICRVSDPRVAKCSPWAISAPPFW
ncbi:hypothetical protein Gpo141_00012470 [Globisporangium polare]